MGIKGVIFDMDNTLLQSSINFAQMKIDIFEFLCSQEVLLPQLPLHNETSSTLIQAALKSGLMNADRIGEMWEIAKRHEIEGMVGALLEPGVEELLRSLHGHYRLAVVTNNSQEAAQSAIRDNQIEHYFDLVVGRDYMNTLKPAPDGFLYVRNQFRDLSAEQWISVGDAWIDGKASQEAGIRFIAYQPNMDKMRDAGVIPEGVITHISELLHYLT